MNSPLLILLVFVSALIIVSLLVDAAVAAWDRANSAMATVAASISVTYTTPSVNPRWGVDQLYNILLLVAWLVILAVIALVADALREKDED